MGRHAACIGFHLDVAVVVVLIINRPALGVHRRSETLQRIIGEFSRRLRTLRHLREIIEGVVLITCQVVLIRIIRRFVDLNQSSQSIGHALALLASLIGHGHRTA